MLLGLAPFLPTLFSGQILFASDQMNAPGAKWFFDALRHGEIPLWENLLYGGMPTFDAMSGDASYPLFILLGFIVPITHFITISFILHLLIGGVSAYFLLQRYFRLDRWLASALAVAYMLNTNYISHIHAGHTAKFYIMSWLPLSLYFLLRAMGPKASWRHMLGLSLTVALFISTSHIQFTYYVLMGYFLIWLFFLVPALRTQQFAQAASLAARFWVPVLLGIGLVFFLLYPPIKYNKDFSVRGAGMRTTYEYATSWSMHPEETASLIVPEFGGLNENYWGRNYFKLNSEYPGLLVWFLALLGLFAFRSRWFWFWGGLGLISILYGLGADTPVFRLFYDTVPGLKNFRAPSMVLFWLATSLLLMSGETLRRLTIVGEESLTEEKRKKVLKWLRIAGFSATGIFAVFGLFPDLAYSIWNGMVDASQIPNFPRQDTAKAAFAMGALRAAALTGILTWGAAAFLIKARRPLAFGIVALIVTAVDLYWVDSSNFIQSYPAEQSVQYDPALDVLKADTSQFRVFGVPGAFEGLNMTYYGFQTVDGHADNELRHYRAYRGDDYQNNPNFMAGLKQDSGGSVSGSPFLDLLNVKYIAFRTPRDPGLKLVRNVSALPRAFFVPAWEAVSDSDAMSKMKQPGFNPRKLAYVTAAGVSSGGKPGDSTAAGITETLKKINRQAYTVDAPGEGVFVTSDVWFPFWRVKVDGMEAPLLRTDFSFRGVLLTPGKHNVEFDYSSPWIGKGLMVSGLSLILLILASLMLRRTGAAGTVPTKPD